MITFDILTFCKISKEITRFINIFVILFFVIDNVLCIDQAPCRLILCMAVLALSSGYTGLSTIINRNQKYDKQ